MFPDGCMPFQLNGNGDIHIERSGVDTQIGAMHTGWQRNDHRFGMDGRIHPEDMNRHGESEDLRLGRPTDRITQYTGFPLRQHFVWLSEGYMGHPRSSVKLPEGSRCWCECRFPGTVHHRN